MMTPAAFDAFCAGLPATFMVVQWGDSHVWKVGSGDRAKVFALGAHWPGHEGSAPGGFSVVFKVSELSFEMLTQSPGIDQAPYFAKRQWVRVHAPDALGEDELRAYVTEAHRIMARQLTRKMQAELGLGAWLAAGG